MSLGKKSTRNMYFPEFDFIENVCFSLDFLQGVKAARFLNTHTTYPMSCTPILQFFLCHPKDADLNIYTKIWELVLVTFT